MEAVSSEDEVFQTTSTDFLTWFTSQPFTTVHPSIRVVDLRSQRAGRGIVATSDIPTETVLFTIPRATILTPETSGLKANLSSWFAKQNEAAAAAEEEEIEEANLPVSWLELILVLIYEYLQGPASKWAPYIAYLPSKASDFNTLIFWCESELSELQASHVRHKLGKDSADRDFRRFILPFVKANESLFYGNGGKARERLSDERLLELAHVMGSVVMAYAFDLENENDDSDDDDEDHDDDDDDDEAEDGWTEDKPKPQQLGMVPFADLLNADAEFNAHLAHLEDRLEMTSIRPIQAGEEVLNYYGPNANSEVLRRYGYTSPKHARYDVVELPWGSIKETIHRTFAAQAEEAKLITRQLEQDGAWTDSEAFVLERDTDGPGDDGLFHTEARFTQLPDDLVDTLSGIVEALVPEARNNPSVLKRKVLEVAKSVLEARIAAYATTSQDDERLLAQAAVGGNVNGRLKMAIDVRLGEKKLLMEALDWTTEKLAKYAEKPGAGSVSNAKNVLKHKRDGHGGVAGQDARKKQKR